MDLSAFAKIAPYLSHPLTLVGFVLLLFFGIHHQLIKSKIIPPVPRTQAPQIVKLFLTYGSSEKQRGTVRTPWCHNYPSLVAT